MSQQQQCVEDYYDARVAGKLRDFTDFLPRVEAAVQTIAEWAPADPRSVLEIGCGVGATTWRMARAWPQARVVGTDISPASIAVAQACFQRENLTYRAGAVADCVIESEFDLVLMMDVYEHVPPAQRPALHALIRRVLTPRARFVLMLPTPEHQAFLRREMPDGLQPVDEDIGLPEIANLAAETDTRLLLYRKVGIWHYGDYCHVVLGRDSTLPAVARRQAAPEGVAILKRAVKRMLGRESPAHGLADHLGPDLLPRGKQVADSRFHVDVAERRRLASHWLGSR